MTKETFFKVLEESNLFYFALLFGVIAFFSRKPLDSFLKKKNEELNNFLDQSEKRLKEAQLIFEAKKKTIESFEKEILNSKNETDKRIKKYKEEQKKKYQHEIQDLEAKLKSRLLRKRKEKEREFKTDFIERVFSELLHDLNEKQAKSSQRSALRLLTNTQITG